MPVLEKSSKLLFWLFCSSVDISIVFLRQLKRFGSDFGIQNPSQNRSRLRFEVLKDVVDCTMELFFAFFNVGRYMPMFILTVKTLVF